MTEKIIKTTQNTYPYGQLFDVEICMVRDGYSRRIYSKWQWLARILIIENSTSPLKMGFSVENLPLGEYYFRFLPLPRLTENYPSVGSKRIFRLGVMLPEYSENTGVIIYDPIEKRDREIYLRGSWVANNLSSGDFRSVGVDIYHRTGEDLFKEVTKFDGTPFWYAKFLPAYVDPETETWSTDQSPAITITSVSEVVDTAFPEVTNYPNCAVSSVRIQASERIQTVPPIIHDIQKGRILKKIKYAGRVNSVYKSSPDPAVQDWVISNGDGYNLPTLQREDGSQPVYITLGDYIMNLTNGAIGTVWGVNATEIGALGDMGLKAGDYFMIFTIESSSYFPDIYLDLLTSDKGGLFGLFRDYEHIDIISIYEAKKYCYRKRYFWDGVIDNQIPFSQWATDNAKTCKLLASRINGQYGLITEDGNHTPVAIFNETNIIKGSYQEVLRPSRETSLDRIVVSYIDGYSALKPLETIVIMHSPNGAKPNNTAVYQERQVDFPTITRPRQALEVGASILKSTRLQKRLISFKTSFQGLYVKAGDLIIVQHKVSEIEEEKSGRVLGLESFSEYVVITVSRPFESQFTSGEYSFAYHDLSQNVVRKDISCYTQEPNKLVIFGTNDIYSVEIGDVFVVSRNSIVDTLFRVNSVTESEDHQCSIEAVEWNSEIHTLNDIYTEPPIASIRDEEPDRISNDRLGVRKEEYFWETNNSFHRIKDDQIID